MMVCIEGIDAAGKATHSKLLAEKIHAKLFSFPAYETPVGHLVAGHLKGYWRAQPVLEVGVEPLASEVHNLNALVFQALQLANRMELAPLLRLDREKGNVVLDRYWPSGYVYGCADGLDPAWLLNVHRVLPQPDVLILLEIDPEESTKRRPERRDRYEKQPGLMECAAKLYSQLWAAKPSMGPFGIDWLRVDASGTVEEVQARIWAGLLLTGRAGLLR